MKTPLKLLLIGSAVTVLGLGLAREYIAGALSNTGHWEFVILITGCLLVVSSSVWLCIVEDESSLWKSATGLTVVGITFYILGDTIGFNVHGWTGFPLFGVAFLYFSLGILMYLVVGIKFAIEKSRRKGT
jgi:hypothetical protein